VRIAGERKWILGRSSHADIIELMDAIGKQATAWKNSLIKLDSKTGLTAGIIRLRLNERAIVICVKWGPRTSF
jgi:hypothetical protein